MKSITVTAAASAALLLCGCAGYPPPTDHLAIAYASIRAAEEVGARSVPEAALHVKLAQEEHAQAKQLLADGKNEEADSMTMRANADAELAIAIAREDAARSKAASISARTDVPEQRPGMPPNAGSVSTTTTTSGVVPAASPPTHTPSK